MASRRSGGMSGGSSATVGQVLVVCSVTFLWIAGSSFFWSWVATSVEPLAEQKTLEMEVQLPAKSVRLTTDIDKAQQILLNLLGNAVKFTDRGAVRVFLTRTALAVRIEVRDTGIGIPTDELPRLFRPFAQVDTGLTRRHGGTGLGLYISRRLATMLGGHIEVESEPGVGSRFALVLPLTVNL